MRTLTIIPYFLFFTILANAQKVRLEGDDSEYLCLNDSIAETFSRSLKEVADSTITILYDYDNGRLPRSIRAVIWTNEGIGRVRLIQGCDRITRDTTFSYNLVELWNYIDKTNFDDVSIPIKSGTWQSHDMFYHITVTTPTKSFIVVVRDYEREPTERHKTPESDSRVMLTNKVDAILK